MCYYSIRISREGLSSDHPSQLFGSSYMQLISLSNSNVPVDESHSDVAVTVDTADCDNAGVAMKRISVPSKLRKSARALRKSCSAVLLESPDLSPPNFNSSSVSGTGQDTSPYMLHSADGKWLVSTTIEDTPLQHTPLGLSKTRTSSYGR